METVETVRQNELQRTNDQCRARHGCDAADIFTETVTHADGDTDSVRRIALAGEVRSVDG